MQSRRFHDLYPATAFIVVLNLGFFALEVIQHLKYARALPGGGQMNLLGGINGKVLWLLGGLTYDDLMDGQAWRIVSHAFLHGGLLHIALNLMALVDLGRFCEPLLSRWKLTVAYSAGVLGSAAGVIVSHKLTHRGGITIGASGAVFSLVGLLLVWSIRGRHEEIRDAMTHTLLWALIMGGAIPNISHGAHIGGLVAGAIFGLFVRDYVTSKEGERWRIPGMICAAVGALALTFSIVHYFRHR